MAEIERRRRDKPRDEERAREYRRRDDQPHRRRSRSPHRRRFVCGVLYLEYYHLRCSVSDMMNITVIETGTMMMEVGVELQENVTCKDSMLHLAELKTLITSQISTVTLEQAEREEEKESTGEMIREVVGTENERKDFKIEGRVGRKGHCPMVRLGERGKEREVEIENQERVRDRDDQRERGMNKKRIFLTMSG